MAKETTERKVVAVMAYTTKELAEIYGVTLKAFQTWMHNIRDQVGPKIGRYYTIIQVKKIFHLLGDPNDITAEK
jgi:hypothetical protein